jgi:hypothetical protein
MKKRYTTKTRIIYIATILLLFNSGCFNESGGWNITQTSDPLHPIIKYKFGIFSPSKVHDFTLSIDNTNIDNKQWQFHYEYGKNPPRLETITYGKLPEGYTEDIPPSSLNKDKIYKIYIKYGDYVTVRKFTITTNQKGNLIIKDIPL